MNFHHGNPSRSKRLKNVLQCLRLAGKVGMTTLAIQRNVNTTRPSSDISELRASGHRINTKYVGKFSGSKIYNYTLA